MRIKKCIHKGESQVLLTNELRRCPKCGKLYHFDAAPIDFSRVIANERSNVAPGIRPR